MLQDFFFFPSRGSSDRPLATVHLGWLQSLKVEAQSPRAHNQRADPNAGSAGAACSAVLAEAPRRVFPAAASDKIIGSANPLAGRLVLRRPSTVRAQATGQLTAWWNTAAHALAKLLEGVLPGLRRWLRTVLVRPSTTAGFVREASVHQPHLLPPVGVWAGTPNPNRPPRCGGKQHSWMVGRCLPSPWLLGSHGCQSRVSWASQLKPAYWRIWQPRPPVRSSPPSSGAIQSKKEIPIAGTVRRRCARPLGAGVY